MKRREPPKSHNARTRCCWESCGASGERETGTCMISMQYGDKDDTCMVDQVEYPAQGNCKSVIEAPIMASDVHEEDVSSHEVGSPRRSRGGLGSRPLAELANFWKT